MKARLAKKLAHTPFVTFFPLNLIVLIVLYIFVNTLFLPNLLHFLILLAQSLKVLQYE